MITLYEKVYFFADPEFKIVIDYYTTYHQKNQAKAAEFCFVSQKIIQKKIYKKVHIFVKTVCCKIADFL